jgi:hypothetical protein
MQEEEVRLLRAYQIELRILQEKDGLRIHWRHVCSCIAMHSPQPLHCRQQPQNPPGISLQITIWANLLARWSVGSSTSCSEREKEREREKAGKRLTSHLYLQIVCNLINNHNWITIYPNLLLSSSQIFCTMRERERSWSTTLDLSLLQLIGSEDKLTRWSVAKTRGMLRVED